MILLLACMGAPSPVTPEACGPFRSMSLPSFLNITTCAESPHASLIGVSPLGPTETCEGILKTEEKEGWNVASKSDLVEHTMEVSMLHPIENGSQVLSMTCTDVSGATTATLWLNTLVDVRPGN